MLVHIFKCMVLNILVSCRQYIVDSNESAKLSLNFMYEAPPGMKKEDKDEEEPKLELKFDWQKQIPEGKQAPRERH